MIIKNAFSGFCNAVFGRAPDAMTIATHCAAWCTTQSRIQSRIQYRSSKTLKASLSAVLSCLVTLYVSLAVIHANTAYAHEQEHHDLSNELPASAFSTRSRIIANAAEPVMSPSLGGLWSPVYDWPLVAVHANLLSNGKVLAWDATPDDSDEDPHTTDNFTTRVTLWDPISNTHTATNNDTNTDLFCAGSAHMWDGRILFAGGDSGRARANGPLANSNIYNPETNTWHRTENMHTPRWYSSVAALGNGELLTYGGSYNPSVLAEVFQFDQTWRALDALVSPLPVTGDYSWIQSTPEGSVLAFGPDNFLADITTDGAGGMEVRATRDDIALRDYGSYAMFDTGKILVSGGADASRSAIIIDTSTHQTTSAGDMIIGRRQHNLTILADGSVLATGGNSDGTRFYSAENGVFTPELWDPQTNQWRVQNPMRGDRQYHSVALLLPDGRVLSAGGGICGDCFAAGYEERNAEIYSPAYLFAADSREAARPVLSQVPELVNYAESVRVITSANHTIAKAHLIKLGSATHSENQDQRLVPLSFSQSGNQLNLTMASSRAAAPPGHYLLFVVDDNGVPSVGSMVKLGQPVLRQQQLVSTVLESGAWDNYITEPVQGQMIVQVAANEPVDLFVTLDQPASAGTTTRALCEARAITDADRACSVQFDSATDVFIAVTGSARTEYSLRFVQNSIPPQVPMPAPEVVLPPQNNTAMASPPASQVQVNEGTTTSAMAFNAVVEQPQGVVESFGEGFVSEEIAAVSNRVSVGGGWLSPLFGVFLVVRFLLLLSRSGRQIRHIGS